jgi:hypothetical protein
LHREHSISSQGYTWLIQNFDATAGFHKARLDKNGAATQLPPQGTQFPLQDAANSANIRRVRQYSHKFSYANSLRAGSGFNVILIPTAYNRYGSTCRDPAQQAAFDLNRLKTFSIS